MHTVEPNQKRMYVIAMFACICCVAYGYGAFDFVYRDLGLVEGRTLNLIQTTFSHVLFVVYGFFPRSNTINNVVQITPTRPPFCGFALYLNEIE